MEGLYGNGLTFTLGRGTDIVLHAVNAMKKMAINRNVHDIFNNFKDFWRELTSESQLRWVIQLQLVKILILFYKLSINSDRPRKRSHTSSSSSYFKCPLGSLGKVQ